MVTQETFAAILLEDPDGRWEIVRCRLREKPVMSSHHNEVCSELARQIPAQLRPDEFRVRINSAHVSAPNGDVYIPDLFIVSTELARSLRERVQTGIEVFPTPMPFVVEVWSPSTGTYDVDHKLPGYQARGDQEIWRVHPFDCSVSVWRRQPDGTYEQTELRRGTVALHALPNVIVDLDALFDSL